MATPNTLHSAPFPGPLTMAPFSLVVLSAIMKGRESPAPRSALSVVPFQQYRAKHGPHASGIAVPYRAKLRLGDALELLEFD